MKGQKGHEETGEGGPKKVCRYAIDPSPSSLPVVREFIRSTLRPFASAQQYLDDIVSATHEACKNAVLHNPECGVPVDIICEVGGNAIVVEVIDRGKGFDPRILPPGPPEPDALKGRGFFIIYSLMDDVETRTGVDGTRIRMCKRLAGLQG